MPQQTSEPISSQADNDIDKAVAARMAVQNYQQMADNLKKETDDLEKKKTDLEVAVKKTQEDHEKKVKNFATLEKAHENKLEKIKEIILSDEEDIKNRRGEVEAKEKGMKEREENVKTKEEEVGSRENALENRENKVKTMEEEMKVKNSSFQDSNNTLQKALSAAESEKNKYEIAVDGIEQDKVSAAALLNDARTVMEVAEARAKEIDDASKKLGQDQMSLEREQTRLKIERGSFEPQWNALQELQTWIIDQQKDKEGPLFSDEITKQLEKIIHHMFPKKSDSKKEQDIVPPQG